MSFSLKGGNSYWWNRLCSYKIVRHQEISKKNHALLARIVASEALINLRLYLNLSYICSCVSWCKINVMSPQWFLVRAPLENGVYEIHDTNKILCTLYRICLSQKSRGNRRTFCTNRLFCSSMCLGHRHIIINVLIFSTILLLKP